MPHPFHYSFGLLSILSAFLTGAFLGIFFHREEWWGGYDSFRRRLARLGHIAQAALGMLNLLYALVPIPPATSALAAPISALLVTGTLSMPAVCFLSAWKKPFRHLFFIPVASLFGAVCLMFFSSLR